jgi:DNA repair protein RadC
MYTLPIYSLHLVQERTQAYASTHADDARSAAAILAALIGDRDCEHLAVLLVDAGNKVVGSSIVAIGGLSGIGVRCRDVFKAAIVHNAAGIILGHNHPSGDPTPSKEDLAFTKRVKEAAEMLGIPLIDHVITTNTGRSYSIERMP